MKKRGAPMKAPREQCCVLFCKRVALEPGGRCRTCAAIFRELDAAGLVAHSQALPPGVTSPGVTPPP